VLSQDGHPSFLGPAVTVAACGCVGHTGCPRSHRWCLRRDMLVSVHRRSLGLWDAALNIQPAIFSTKPQAGPGKAVPTRWLPGARVHRWAAIHRGMLGTTGWGHHPPSHSVPPLTLTSQLIWVVPRGRDAQSFTSRAVCCAAGQGDPSPELWAGCWKRLTQPGLKPAHCVLPSPCSAQSRPGERQGTRSPLSWSSTHRPAVVFGC